MTKIAVAAAAEALWRATAARITAEVDFDHALRFRLYGDPDTDGLRVAVVDALAAEVEAWRHLELQAEQADVMVAALRDRGYLS